MCIYAKEGGARSYNNQTILRPHQATSQLWKQFDRDVLILAPKYGKQLFSLGEVGVMATSDPAMQTFQDRKNITCNMHVQGKKIYQVF